MYTNWELLLGNWMAANYINASTGPYGYEGDPVLSEVEAWFLSSYDPEESFILAPGEGIYTHKDTIPAMGDPFVRYAGMRRNPPAVSGTQTYAGGALLSYNVDLDNGVNWYFSDCYPFSVETAPISQTSPNVRISIMPRNVSPRQNLPPLSYPISMGDMLRRKGNAIALSFSDTLKTAKEKRKKIIE
jgi:hypothetical protein